MCVVRGGSSTYSCTAIKKQKIGSHTVVNIGCSRIFLADGRENPADGRENPTFTMVVGPEGSCFLMGAVS